jgi:hypothetical protein
MKVVWIIQKVLGMLFVGLTCLASIHRMSMVSSLTGNYLFLVATLLMDAGLLYWAYRVIWKPIKKKV